MYECNICYNDYINMEILKCCKEKHMCDLCKDTYEDKRCPFCRQNMNRKPTIIILNKNTILPSKSSVIMCVKNYNIVKIW